MITTNLGKLRSIAYSKTFYNKQRIGSLSSAEIVLSHVFNALVKGTVKSVLDFGCGVGTWLTAAKNLGANELYGYDGHWIKPRMLLDDAINFFPLDLEQGLQIERGFDLAICLEVAEHISTAAGSRLVKTLCGSSRLVLFGAAIPGQGGAHHVNEQWQSYWIDKFKENSFEARDFIRPRVWNDSRVEFWYAQNSFIFIDPRDSHLDRIFCNKVEVADLVHPRLFNQKINDPSIKDTVRTFKKLPNVGLRIFRKFI